MENTAVDFISFYFFRRVFQIEWSFTGSRNCLTCYGKGGGADNHKKEVACHIKKELELSEMLTDK